MNIISLKIKNFLSISDVEIRPGGNVIQIVGGNNQGKTSILKALEWAIRGGVDGSLVKLGQDAAEVVVELDDKTVIRRRINADGKQSVSVKKEGFNADKPQTLLDALFESSSFNPLSLLDPKQRRDAILSSIDIKVDEAKLKEELGDTAVPLPPLDYGQHGLKVIDQAHKYFYQRRAEANKDALDKKKRWETYSKDLPPEVTSNITKEDVKAEYDKAVQAQMEAAKKLEAVRATHATAKKAQERLNKYCEAVDAIDVEIDKLKQSLSNLEARKAEGQKFVDQAKAEVPEALESDAPDLERYQQLGLEIEKVNAKFAEVDKIAAVKKQREMVDQINHEYEKAQAIADDLTFRVEALAGPIKKKLMETAEMPITGLEYKDGEFLVEGVPVDNLSTSKAMKLAIGVARKLAKKTKLICLDGVEALDKETFGMLLSEIENDGFTYFLTVVGDGFDDGKSTKIKMQDGAAVQ